MNEPGTRRLRALLFDFDHTLADLGRWVDWAQARAELAALYAGAGVDAEAIFRRPGAFSVIQALDEALAERHSRARAEAVKAEAFEILATHERAGAARAGLLPGAATALDAATASGLGLAIVSANAESAVRCALERLGLEDRFAAVVGRTPTLPLKPEPHMFREALRLLDCPAEGALVVGDSPNDMRAAAAAEILAVGVRGGEGSQEKLFASGACYVLADLSALPTLLALWVRAAD